jgi:hypothetical protein
MISCYLQGGLGNQMFQISATYALGLENNDRCCFDFDACNTPLQGNTSIKYKDNVLSKVCNSKVFPSVVYHEPNFSYDKIPYKENSILVGYFQSEKYFKNYENEIRDLFKCDEDIKKIIFEKYPQLNNEKTCSIHVRRGDYIKFNDHHEVQSIDYYKNALSYFDNDTHFLIFSDDINWCKNNFDFLENKTYCEGNEDFEDLYIMSFCKNNIMANSSFSWWGAWLNENINKTVISPKKWFGVKKSDFNLSDLYFEKTILL